MTVTETPVELADRLTRRRVRIFTILGIYFLVGQTAFFSNLAHPGGAESLKVGAWLVWAVVLLLVLATGGNFIRGRAVRHLLEDEVTQTNRRKAYTVGFWAAAGASVLVYVLTMFEPVSGREAVHLILTAAVAGALLSFARLERRSLRDG